MEASVVDMRHKMKEVVKALDRNEEVQILYHGKLKGVIKPVKGGVRNVGVREHGFFGMLREQTESVDQVLADLRGPRFK